MKRNRKGLTYLLVFMLIASLFPTGIAFAADSTKTETIYYNNDPSQPVGNAALSLTGSTLTFTANITASDVTMTSIKLTMGSGVVVNVPATTTAQQRSFTQTVSNVDYDSMKDYRIAIGLAAAGTEGSKTFLSNATDMSGWVPETYGPDKHSSSWNSLTWNYADPETLTTVRDNMQYLYNPLRYFQDKGAVWMYTRSNSMIKDREERAYYTGNINLPNGAEIVTATLAITADDGYAFAINGRTLPLPVNLNMEIVNGSVQLKRSNVPPPPTEYWHFQSVSAYDLAKGNYLRGGNNSISLEVYNRLGNPGAENVSGVIFRMEIKYRTSNRGPSTSNFDKGGTLPPIPVSKAKLVISHQLVKVNGTTVTGTPTIHPGDTLTFAMKMENKSSVPVRPETITVRFSEGLYAVAGDNANPPWTTYTNSLRYTHDGTNIPVNQTLTKNYVLRVRDNASGDQNTTSDDVPSVKDDENRSLTNQTPAASGETFSVTPKEKQKAKLVVTHELIKVNDAAVTSSTVIRPGDKLTFRMTMNNKGTMAVRPTTIPVTFTSGLYAKVGDNASPTWTTYTSSLLYTHDGSFIEPSRSKSADYILRVGENASGQQTVESKVPTVVDEKGDTLTNDAEKGSATVDVVPQAAAKAGLKVTHRLIKINGADVTGTPTIHPGDVLTFAMDMENKGETPVRPGSITVNFSSGLYADGKDNASPPWTTYTNSLGYTHDGTMIAVGGKLTKNYLLRVKDDATGDQTVNSGDMPTVVDSNGRNQNNETPKADGVSFPVKPRDKDKAQLIITHELIRVNDAAVTSSTVIRPGDKLTFRMKMANKGSITVRPNAVTVNYSGGLYANASDNSNPPWTMYTNALRYTHDGTYIQAGREKTVDYILRVRDNASGPQTVDNDVPTVVDEKGNTLPNDAEKGSATVDVVPQAAAKVGLKVTHRLIKINGADVTGAPTIHPGDMLTFAMDMENKGETPVRPGSITVNFSSGLYAEGRDNANPPWTTYTNSLGYTHDGTMIAVGGKLTKNYVLRVRDDATGDQTVNSGDMPTVVDSNGKNQNNETPKADGVTLPVKPRDKDKAQLIITHELIRVNDAAVTSSTVIRPGDKLTFRMKMANKGSITVRPNTVTVNYTSGLYANAGDNANPPWTTYTSELRYTHDGTYIQPGKEKAVEYILRVRDNASGEQGVDSDVPTVIDEKGNTVPNESNKGGTDFDVVPEGQKKADLRIAHRLIQVNGVNVTGTPTIRPGDVLTFAMDMMNKGNLPVRPDTVTVTFTSGLYGAAEDNTNPPWTTYTTSLKYTHDGTYISVGGTMTKNYKLRVRDDATGNQTVDSDTPSVIDEGGKTIPNTTPDGDGITFPVTPKDSTDGKAKLVVKHELIKVNDAAATSATVIRPGDKLTFLMTMTNQGTAPVRPTTIPVKFSSGLYAQVSDNTNPPWTTYSTSLTYTHDGGLIAPAGSKTAEYVLRVRADASGNQNVESDVPSVIDEKGNPIPNETDKSSTGFPVVPQTSGNGSLQITHQLIKINDAAYRSGDVIRPGDRLTFNMNMKNVGTQSVRPDTIMVNFTSGLYVQSGDNSNPPWTNYTSYLLYNHGGSLIQPGNTTTVPYVLRVKSDSTGGQRVDTYVPTILDDAGKIINNTTPSASLPFDVNGATGGAGKLDITHTLVRVNDQPATASTVVRAGDKLTFSMNMTNSGSIAVRPTQIPVYFTSGLYAQAGDNGNPPWTIYANSLLYTHNGSYINPGTTQSYEYVLRVRSDANGAQSVWTELPTLVDVNGNTVTNNATQKVTLTISIVPSQDTVQLTSKFWLSAVNGTSTGLGPDSSMPRINLVPGDVLTYTLRTINSGSRPAAPGQYTMTLPSNQSFNAADNPGWELRDGLLVYTYTGGLLSPSAQVDALLHLKLNTNAIRGNQTFTYTYNLVKVRMPDETVMANNNPVTLTVPVYIGEFGAMERTGDSGMGMVPVALGLVLLMGGGVTLLLTRRKRFQG